MPCSLRNEPMKERKLILVLGDQLSRSNPALQQVDPAADTILLAEVAEESPAWAEVTELPPITPTTGT